MAASAWVLLLTGIRSGCCDSNSSFAAPPSIINHRSPVPVIRNRSAVRILRSYIIMKRMSSSSDLINRPTPAGEHNILDDQRSRSRAPPKPPRTFSRSKVEKQSDSKISSESDFNDSFEEDISDNFTALVEKSFEQLEITPTTRQSACDSKCLREWVLRMCLLEKLEKTAIDALEAMEIVEDETPGEMQTRGDNPGWMGPKLTELMEPPKKRRRFCSKFFRNLSPSRLLLKQKQREDRKRAKRRQTASAKKDVNEEQKNRTFSADKCRLNLSRVPGFFFRTFWKDGTKHTEL